ncbi:MAG: hypothetical protein ACI83B_001317 [Sediminicola sp.]|mgnify:CR=1 FL=1|jgi:hypothetical protein|tara:strand:+ start:3148 stop:3558 length:411 start_codon:yes stop_codon:yes gene_type:complete
MEKNKKMKKFQTNSASTSFNILADEAAVIHFDTSNYYSLNAMGTFIWNLMIDKSQSLDDLAQIISVDYNQDIEIIESHLEPFISNLLEAGLILSQPTNLSIEKVEMDRAIKSTTKEYEQPDMVHFGNLETLILSGE